MPYIAQHQLQNRLLSRLSTEDFALVGGLLEPIEYPSALVISEPRQPIPYMLFPEKGLISIVAVSREGLSAESGLVGREGFTTSAIMLGTDRVPHRIDVQIGGYGNRIAVPDFRVAVIKSESLRTVLLRFVQTLAVQTAFTAMSNAIYTVEERLARWLLMCHDRSESDDLNLTHKFMSTMLAVRRASVTNALQTLSNNRLIRVERGYITITNRANLEEFAGDAYGTPENEYRELLGPI